MIAGTAIQTIILAHMTIQCDWNEEVGRFQAYLLTLVHSNMNLSNLLNFCRFCKQVNASKDGGTQNEQEQVYYVFVLAVLWIVHCINRFSMLENWACLLELRLVICRTLV